MTSEEVQTIVAGELAAWRPPVVDPGTTIGTPWTADHYAPHVERLRASLVQPYKQRFELREYDDPGRGREGGEAEYWVVAVTKEMYLWYDESTGEFGVGEPSSENSLPASIGLRGDLVGSFCAW